MTLLLALLVSAAPLRPVHTYSIVARDPKTGELGVAVQSHWFSVGSSVTWAEAGVGAVATQSFVDPAYGPLGLELMRAGKPAEAALASLLAGDAQRDVRQVAMIDARGTVATHTGVKCIAAAGGQLGKEYAVQANLMEKDSVWPAMARAYETATGDLAERMLKALEAAEREGGDIRGRQSAALLVVRAKPSGRSWDDIIVHLRVEDHLEPLKELRRVLNVDRAYERMRAAEAAVGRGDLRRALEEVKEAQRLAPGNPEMIFWPAVRFATSGHLEAARPLFREVFKADPNWKELVRRLPKAGRIPDDEEGRKLVEEITKIEP